MTSQDHEVTKSPGVAQPQSASLKACSLKRPGVTPSPSPAELRLPSKGLAIRCGWQPATSTAFLLLALRHSF